MILPTPKCALLAAASVPAAALTLSAFPERFYLAFFFPILTLALFLHDFARSPHPSLLRATFAPPGALLSGREEELPLTLSLSGLKSPLKVRLLFQTAGPLKVVYPDSPSASGGFVLMDKDTAEGTIVLKLLPKRRGRARLEKIWLAYRGRLGYAETRRGIPIDREVLISQDTVKVKEDVLNFISLEFSSGLKSRPFPGAGSEFENLVDFSAGMDNRLIDWKRSARHRKLLAKEFKAERNQHVILGFDTGRLMLESVGKDTRLDHFIRAGLSLAWISLRSGDLVGGCAFDSFFRAYLPPGRTPSFFTKLQRFASFLDYRQEESNYTLSLTELAARLKQRSLVVLFTEFSDSAQATLLLECLELLRRKHTVVFVSTPDPLSSSLPGQRPESFLKMAESVIADKLNRERSVVLEKMSRLGVQVLDAKGPGLTAALLGRYLSIKRRGFI
ncbi:MAG: DUF58 domain-containing protein [Deltaproteobacteria bacterium]|jgi:uncharacterized protein (DUF58 family)|nr:DUF58 domain-containing protein [Deltaproteobacteria bacterium]